MFFVPAPYRCTPVFSAMLCFISLPLKNTTRNITRDFPIHKAFLGCVKKHSLLPFSPAVMEKQSATKPATRPWAMHGKVIADNVLSTGWLSFTTQFYLIFFPTPWTTPFNLLRREFCNSSFPLSHSTHGNHLPCLSVLFSIHNQNMKCS